MSNLYLDMDGVVADFNEYVKRVHNLPVTRDSYDDESWAKIVSNQRVYKDLKRTVYADELVRECRHFCKLNDYKLFFLTAIPKRNDVPLAYYDKSLWALKYFTDIPVLFGPHSKDKKNFCKKNDILIDDRPSNIKDWKNTGGIAILHTDYEKTVKELYEYSSDR